MKFIKIIAKKSIINVKSYQENKLISGKAKDCATSFSFL